MPNDYFRFKQFLINQDQCAMKVCTDSCILGAYTPVANAKNILDIGTGTGLLALMVAQRATANIDAVEIDAAAAQQARQNIAQSPWPDRIKVFNQSLSLFATQRAPVYDLIICNPPFYAGSHKSEDTARNVAMHSQELTFSQILHFSQRLLGATGQLFILLPPAESLYFKTLAQAANWHLLSSLKIFTSTADKHIRTVQGFGRVAATSSAEENLYIRHPDHSYTPAFRELLRDYYLIF